MSKLCVGDILVIYLFIPPTKLSHIFFPKRNAQLVSRFHMGKENVSVHI